MRLREQATVDAQRDRPFRYARICADILSVLYGSWECREHERHAQESFIAEA